MSNMTNPGAGATMNDLSSDTEIRQSQFMLEPASEKDNYPGLENAQPSFPDATKHVAKCNSVADYDEKRRAQGPRGNNGDDSYDRAAQSGCNKQLSTDAITFKEKDVMNPSWDLAEALRAPVDGGGDLHRNRVPFPLVAKSPNKPLPETSEAATEKGIRTDDSSTLDAKTSDEQTSGLGRIILPNAALLRGFEYFRNCVPPLRPIISPLMPRRDVGFAIISKIEAESLDAVRYTEAAINEGNMIYFFKSLVPAAFKDNTTFVDKIRDINTPLGDLENLLQSWPNFFVGVRQIQVETPYLAMIKALMRLSWAIRRYGKAQKIQARVQALRKDMLLIIDLILCKLKLLVPKMEKFLSKPSIIGGTPHNRPVYLITRFQGVLNDWKEETFL